MDRSQAETEMLEGYREGLDMSNPEPGVNRSWSYRHGFANARDDRRGQGPRDTAERLRALASNCIAMDTGDYEL